MASDETKESVQTMRAISQEDLGGPDVLREVDLPRPEPLRPHTPESQPQRISEARSAKPPAPEHAAADCERPGASRRLPAAAGAPIEERSATAV